MYLNQKLLESINDGILAIDTEQKIIFSNKQFVKKFISSSKKITQIKFNDIFKDLEISSAFQECFETKEVKKIYDYHIKHKNRDLYFEIMISPLLEENDLKGAVGVFRNVTEAKLTEQMRVDFVANVSHEIKTPLTSIKGFAQVLQAKSAGLPQEIVDYIDKVATNSQRLHTLFNDLLNLSVIESRHRLIKRKVHLPKMLESIKSMLTQNYSHKDVSIVYDLSIEEINVDQKLFEQVLINLIENACKYAGENPVIKISNFIEESNIILTISDDGPGISKEHLGRIFERFYRVDSSRTKEDEQGLSSSTGLGLSIVKHIINKHKGRIWVESKPNEGSIFFIELPVKKYEIQESFQ